MTIPTLGNESIRSARLRRRTDELNAGATLVPTDEPVQLRRFGSSCVAKMLRLPLKVQWCRVAAHFHGVASPFRRPKTRHGSWNVSCARGQPKSINEPAPCSTHALGLLPSGQLASTIILPRLGSLQDRPHDSSHSSQIFLACSGLPRPLKHSRTWDSSKCESPRRLLR